MENKRTQIKVALTYATMFGLAAIVIDLLFYFAGADVQSKGPQWIGLVLMIVFIIMGIKSYRDQDLEGIIPYGKSLGTGVLIGLFGGIIIGLFSILKFTVIDPGLGQKMIDAAQQKMIDEGRPEEQIEMAMAMTKKFMNPLMLFIFSTLWMTFLSLICSLIISVFMKKDKNPFNAQV